jgi:hypothetical protein
MIYDVRQTTTYVYNSARKGRGLAEGLGPRMDY